MSTSSREPGVSRAEKRTKVLMIGTLLTPEGAQKVKIRDISSTGAHLSSTGRITDGCDALFKRGSLFAAARVAWSRNDQAGIEFYRDLSPTEVASTFHPVN